MNHLKKIWIWCKRIRNRRGYGVHSPFAFNLITWVIYEKLPYYGYEELKEIRKSHLRKAKHLMSDVEYRTEKVDKLLFRLVNDRRPHTIMEIGTSSGISTLYMSLVNKQARCFTFDYEGEMNDLARQLFNTVENVEYLTGNLHQNLSETLHSLPQVDFIHLNHSYVTDDIFELCLSKTHSQSIMVVDGIYSSNSMRDWWGKIVSDERTGVTFDLYFVGLVFFDKAKIKQHYVVNF